MDDTLGRLSHHNETTDELARNVDVDLSRTLNLSDIELDVGEVASGLGVSTLLVITAAGRTAAVETVDGGLGRAGELSSRHVPVLESGVGVTEPLDVLNTLRGVEVTPRLVEGVERRGGGDASALRSRVTRATRVRASEAKLVGVHGLPVSPETVDLGVVHPEDGVEAGELSGEELTSARGIPVNGVVDLLERSTVGAGRSELVEGGGSGHDIVHPLLVGSLAEVVVGGSGEAIGGRAVVDAASVLIVPLSVLATESILGEVVSVERVLHVDGLETATVGDLDIDHRLSDNRRDAVDGPIPEGGSQRVGCINVLLAVLGRVKVGQSLGVLDEDLLVKQNVGTVPGQEKALAVGTVSRPAIAASATTTVPLNERLSMNTSNLEEGLPIGLLSVVHGADSSNVKIPEIYVSIGGAGQQRSRLTRWDHRPFGGH